MSYDRVRQTKETIIDMWNPFKKFPVAAVPEVKEPDFKDRLNSHMQQYEENVFLTLTDFVTWINSSPDAARGRKFFDAYQEARDKYRHEVWNFERKDR